MGKTLISKVNLVRVALQVLLAVLLVSCGDLPCVEGDDWGYPKIFVPAYYPPSSTLGDGRDVSSPQVVPAVDTGQVLIDVYHNPLVLTITEGDQWTSWFASRGSLSRVDGWDPTAMVPNRECVYKVTTTLTGYGTINIAGYNMAIENHNQNYNTNDPSSTRNVNDLAPAISKARRYAETSKGAIQDLAHDIGCTDPTVVFAHPDNVADCRVPCYMRDGMGLYIGLANNNGKEDAVVVTKHIPDYKNPEVPYLLQKDGQMLDNNASLTLQGKTGYLLAGLPIDVLKTDEGVLPQNGDRIYFKIVDTYYKDNSGGYTIRIKSGTKSPSVGTTSKIVHTFTDPIRAAMMRMWVGLTQDTHFLLLLRSFIGLYIVVYSLCFMMGMIQNPSKDVIFSIIRLAVVFQIFSPNSFDFFYNHFFMFFLDGINQLLGLVVAPFANFDKGDVWASLDFLLNTLLSPETQAKVWSTLLSNAIGFIFVIVFYVALVFFLIATARVVFAYICSFVSMCILISVAPIFLTLMLFGKTKELFSEYINQFLAFALELLILFAAVGMFAAIIINFLQQTLGFRVCWETFFNLNLLGHDDFMALKFWFPHIRYDQYHYGNMYLDVNGNGVYTWVNRYYDMPYLDPVKDKAKMISYASNKNFLTYGVIILFVASCFLMKEFIKAIGPLVDGLKGDSPTASTGVWSGGAVNTAWNAVVAATIGTKGSANKEMQESAWSFGPRGAISPGRIYYGTITDGRDGGLLGSAIRANSRAIEVTAQAGKGLVGGGASLIYSAVTRKSATAKKEGGKSDGGDENNNNLSPAGKKSINKKDIAPPVARWNKPAPELPPKPAFLKGAPPPPPAPPLPPMPNLGAPAVPERTYPSGMARSNTANTAPSQQDTNSSPTGRQNSSTYEENRANLANKLIQGNAPASPEAQQATYTSPDGVTRQLNPAPAIPQAPVPQEGQPVGSLRLRGGSVDSESKDEFSVPRRPAPPPPVVESATNTASIDQANTRLYTPPASDNTSPQVPKTEQTSDSQVLQGFGGLFGAVGDALKSPNAAADQARYNENLRLAAQQNRSDEEARKTEEASKRQEAEEERKKREMREQAARDAGLAPGSRRGAGGGIGTNNNTSG